MSVLRIGTRESALALWQAGYVRTALARAHSGLQVELVPLSTRGDRNRQKALSEMGGTGLFTKEIENALLDGSVDLVVHSLKDLPTRIRGDLALVAVPVREDPADALVSREGMTLEELPEGAKVLTGSPRRRAQLLHRRPDLEVRPVRGNVPTRLKKLDGSDAQAVVLACAGLLRLGCGDRITQRLDPVDFLPACGQGALAIEIRSGDTRLAELCRAIDDIESHLAVTAERAFLDALGGGCQMPAGAYVRPGGASPELAITGMLSNPDGSRLLRDSVGGTVLNAGEAVVLGWRLAEALLAAGGRKILEETWNSASYPAETVQ